MESPDFDEAVTGAVAGTPGPQDKMADYFFTNAPGRTHLISDIARCSYLVVSAKDENPASQ